MSREFAKIEKEAERPGPLQRGAQSGADNAPAPGRSAPVRGTARRIRRYETDGCLASRRRPSA